MNLRFGKSSAGMRVLGGVDIRITSFSAGSGNEDDRARLYVETGYTS